LFPDVLIQEELEVLKAEVARTGFSPGTETRRGPAKSIPKSIPDLQDSEDKLAPEAEFEPIKQAVQKSAVGNVLAVSRSAIHDSRLAAETKRLRIILEGSGFFASEPDLAILIGRLVETKSITENVNEWRSLSAAISGNRPESIWSAIRKLAKNIKT